MKLPEGIALAAYSGEIQALALFGTLSPILFVVGERGKRPNKIAVKLAALYAVVVVAVSTLGIVASLVAIISQDFTLGTIAYPMVFIVMDANAIVIYVLAAAGLLQRLITWTQWPFF